MRDDIATAFSTALRADAHPDFAVAIDIALSSGTLYRTTWSRGFAFGGNAYVRDRFSFGSVGGALRPQAPSVQLAIDNLRDPVTDEEYPWPDRLDGINGTSVSFRVVTISQLADATAQLDETLWSVTKGRIEGDDCILDLGPPQDPGRMRTPAPSLRAARCFAQFKDGFCRSTSSFDACPNKSVAECIARHPQSALRISQYPFDTDMRRRDG